MGQNVSKNDVQLYLPLDNSRCLNVLYMEFQIRGVRTVARVFVICVSAMEFALIYKLSTDLHYKKEISLCLSCGSKMRHLSYVT